MQGTTCKSTEQDGDESTLGYLATEHGKKERQGRLHYICYMTHFATDVAGNWYMETHWSCKAAYRTFLNRSPGVISFRTLWTLAFSRDVRLIKTGVNYYYSLFASTWSPEVAAYTAMHHCYDNPHICGLWNAPANGSCYTCLFNQQFWMLYL